MGKFELVGVDCPAVDGYLFEAGVSKPAQTVIVLQIAGLDMKYAMLFLSHRLACEDRLFALFLVLDEVVAHLLDH